MWEWGECEDAINFEDLWFAVRGGGGGTWGVVTSLYYQLHELPGRVQVVGNPKAAEILPSTEEIAANPEKGLLALAIVEAYLRFSLTFLYLPEKLDNVTEIESRSCNSPGVRTING